MSKRKKASQRLSQTLSKWMTPGFFALAGLIVFPSLPAEADVSALIASRSGGAESWRSFIVPAPAGSLHSEELVFHDSQPREGLLSLSKGIVTPHGKRVALAPAYKAQPETPDEARVTRHLKKGRILASDRVQPPKDFSAGSILDRQAHLLAPDLTEERITMFQKPAIKGREIQIAMEFHSIKPRIRDYGVPTMIANLFTSDRADSLATAYADPSPDYAEQSPFDSILVERPNKRFVPDAGKNAHSWAAAVLSPSVFTEKEQNCLAQAIYFEAATEPLKGQAAVAQVVLNRVRNPTFPNSICGVVYQNEDWRNRCQFSFACDRIPDVVWSKPRFAVAKQIALAVTAGKIYLKEVGDSTHYHAAYVRPNWARTMKRVSRIGLHIFYRTYNGGWT